jgi:predicted nucleic acid-binding protein
MDILVDTGILLRLVIPSDALHSEVRRCIKVLRSRGERLVTLTQNIAEFWNVCTRPVEARGGYGFTVEVTARKIKLIEPNLDQTRL